MKSGREFLGFMVLGLCALWTACSATRHTAPESTAEFERFVLIIEEAPDGRVVHSWQPAEHVDLSRFRFPREDGSVAGRLVHVAARQRDCHGEFNDCQDDCMSRPLPPGYEHVTQGSGAHGSICRKKCWQAYLDCGELQERQQVRRESFSGMGDAIEWVKRNRKMILVGSVVVVAGVVFVVVSAGAGAVVLAPVVLMASAGAVSVPQVQAVSP
jgi:hypothetical protein